MSDPEIRQPGSKIYYTCRMCGDRYTRAGGPREIMIKVLGRIASPDDFGVQLNTTGNVQADDLGALDVHYCSTGQKGIADVVGIRSSPNE